MECDTLSCEPHEPCDADEPYEPCEVSYLSIVEGTDHDSFPCESCEVRTQHRVNRFVLMETATGWTPEMMGTDIALLDDAQIRWHVGENGIVLREKVLHLLPGDDQSDPETEADFDRLVSLCDPPVRRLIDCLLKRGLSRSAFHRGWETDWTSLPRKYWGCDCVL